MKKESLLSALSRRLDNNNSTAYPLTRFLNLKFKEQTHHLSSKFKFKIIIIKTIENDYRNTNRNPPLLRAIKNEARCSPQGMDSI